jgi:hypothetical protein
MKTPKNVVIDNVAIRRRIEGHHTIELNEAERFRAIRVLNREGLTDAEISRVLGYGDDYVGKWRRELGLPRNVQLGVRQLVHA